MTKNSATPCIRIKEEEYQKLKALKEKYNVSWPELIAYANKVLDGGYGK